MHPTAERNQSILLAIESGERQSRLARTYGISRNRICQIARKTKERVVRDREWSQLSARAISALHYLEVDSLAGLSGKDLDEIFSTPRVGRITAMELFRRAAETGVSVTDRLGWMGRFELGKSYREASMMESADALGR